VRLRLVATFHNIGNKLLTSTEQNPTRAKISFIPWHNPEITQVSICRISYMVCEGVWPPTAAEDEMPLLTLTPAPTA